MKNVFFSFLAFLMLMPSLACAMPVCGQPLKSAVLTASVQEPCHGHKTSQKSDKQKSDHVRFVIDCMGVDLQKADAAHFEKADFRTALIDLPFIDNAAASQTSGSSPQIIRGPPPDRSPAYQSYASIILTTQRLRL